MALTDFKTVVDAPQAAVIQEAESVDKYAVALDRLTKKTIKVLRLLCESGEPNTVLSSSITQPDLARKLHVTRQALSVHVSRLAEAGFIQVGRGFINVTENGMKAAGYHHSPVILIVRVAPQHHRDAYDKIKRIHASEIFRVAGDADFAILLEQSDLDKVLQDLYAIPGILDTKSLIATETVRQTLQ
jgi:DNA-binding Lrp family transcriptional regulator